MSGVNSANYYMYDIAKTTTFAMQQKLGKIGFGRVNSANDYIHDIAQTITFAM